MRKEITVSTQWGDGLAVAGWVYCGVWGYGVRAYGFCEYGLRECGVA